MDPGRGRDLRQIHGAELAGPITPMRNGLPSAARAKKHAMGDSCLFPPVSGSYSAACLRRAARSTASSSQASTGVKSRWAMYSGRLKRRMALETAL